MDDYIKNRMKENGDVYRNALERIVQKYSRVDGSGMEVCLQSMTCRTEKGIQPWDGKDVERQMESLKRVADSAEKSATGLDNSREIQQDDPQTCSDSSSGTMAAEMERSAESSLWESSVDSSRLLNSAVSESVLRGEPEHDDQLEQTLNSLGSSLLDLYPSMLSQLGQAWRRQQCPAPRPDHHWWRMAWQDGGEGQGAPEPLIHSDATPVRGSRLPRQQIDRQFDELYQRLVCQGRVAPPQQDSASLQGSASWSSSSLAALALSPLGTRVRKRDRALEPGACPESKRFREPCAFSPGWTWQQHAHQLRPHSSDSHVTSTAPSVREEGLLQSTLSKFEGKSVVNASRSLKDWRSSSRRRLLYGLLQ
ncbi:hypothetical protein AGOR_G00171360 [Albula goreensis]|uniref:Uncharacterized protein n=1 Tax=Albula goreensis TaxID=1534307 RepID=A0A8T3CTY8_9TELE|nr:hypothetical protein AGOR_G00171360 [Albula goreensis]